MNEREPHELNEISEATPTDPRLDALLDEALAPSDAPAGLNDRILAATSDRFTATQNHAVIGRIGGGFPWRSAAAVLLFALVVGGVWLIQRDADNATDPGNVGPVVVNPTGDGEVTSTPIKLETALDQLAEAELESDWIDDRIDILSMQVAWAEDAGNGGGSGSTGGTGGTGGWGGGAFESLDTAIARDTFDDLADDMGLYF